MTSNSDHIALDTHRGAIDQTTITTQPPLRVMNKVDGILRGMGIEIQEESRFRYRCIRPKKLMDDSTIANGDFERSSNDAQTRGMECSTQCTLYGSATDDPADEVRFSVELTVLAGLNDTYSLDIRRLKGSLKSYKYIYDTLREHAELSR
ncbi:hypothetical protein CPB84DRAFT_1772666 [Gymnopilus junonius]|uniref:non-specific serine/threonine protein kinase n=1 Tax=Gymnopilus junonius TaxID=109634 RepID=A0A9P5NS20_GYMJU|nr:hypothetical protein CPB84DRAFT_1772666 [Gymnopilus junonius]